MRKFGAFLARKPALPDNALEQAPAAAKLVNQADNPLELDEELFSAIGAQLGGENETLRNLLLDANAQIGELDTIKAAVGKLVDPVSKTRIGEAQILALAARQAELLLQVGDLVARLAIGGARVVEHRLQRDLLRPLGLDRAQRRLTAADKRIITLESDLNGARQRAC